MGKELGLAFIVLGIGLVLFGTFLLAGGEAKVGGVVMIGPLPIPFGDARLALLGVLFGLAVFLLTFLWKG